jgi:sigma-B regulation protein RsbU (phosphoserine phosphatase)
MTQATPSGFHQMEGELRREKRLTEASYALHSTLDLPEILELILGAACDGVEADRGTVFIVSDDGAELWSTVKRGDESLEIRLPLGKGLAGSVGETGESIRLADAYDDERFDRSWDKTSGYRTRQMLCTPIRSREGNVVGVFQLLNKRTGDFDDADEAYLHALSMHASLAIENARLHISAIEKERQDREILLVQEVQRVYLPEHLTLDLDGLSGAGMNILCEDASGDYFDFIPLDDGRYAVAIGDVSGHGLKAALVMAQARAFLRAFTSTVPSLADVMSRLDLCLANDLTGGLFMCLFVAYCDPKTGRVQWCNGGNPPPLLHHARDGSVETLDPTGRILGVLPDPDRIEGDERVMETGDMLLLYTDGATEARHPDGTMFEESGLVEFLKEHGSLAPTAFIEALRERLRVFTGADELEDDLTLIAVRKD